METSLLSSPGGNLSAEAHQCSVCQSVNLVGAFRVKQREYLRCSRCGLIFVKRINPEDEKAKYEGGPYYQLFESMHRLELKQAVFERSLREIARIRQPGRLLDVGCGNGLFLNCARSH